MPVDNDLCDRIIQVGLSPLSFQLEGATMSIHPIFRTGKFLVLAVCLPFFSLFIVAEIKAQIDSSSLARAVFLPIIVKSVPIATSTNTPVPTATSTPVPTATSTPLPTGTSLPDTVFIKSHRSFVQSTSFYVVGEILNGTSAAIYSPRIEAKFFDAANHLVGVAADSASLYMTSNGLTNPFKVVLSNAPNSIVRYELVITYRTSSSLDYRYMTVLSQQVRDNSGIEVFGEIRNDNEMTVRYSKVVVTFYDSAGNVTDTDYTYTDGDLAQGQTTIYSINTFKDIDYSSYVVQAQSYLLP